MVLRSFGRQIRDHPDVREAKRQNAVRTGETLQPTDDSPKPLRAAVSSLQAICLKGYR